MIRNGLLFILLFVALIACTSKEEKVIDLDEIIPKSERYNNGDEPDSSLKDTLSNYFDLKLAKDLGMPFSSMELFEEAFFPDRFQPRRVSKLVLKGEDQAVFFGQWSYKDSLKTMNALFNWLDCFGLKCRSLKYLESASFQADAMLLFINDTSMIYISSSQGLNEKQWQLYLKEKYGADTWDLVIIQKKQRKANWYRFDLDEKGKDTTFIKLN